MSLVIDEATLNTLVAERTVLFEHQFHVFWWTVFWLLVVCVVVFVWGYLSRSHPTTGDSTSPMARALLNVGIVMTGNGGTRMLFAVVGAFMVVGIGMCIWADTYFEHRQFERAPQTYVIQRLR